MVEEMYAIEESLVVEDYRPQERDVFHQRFPFVAQDKYNRLLLITRAETKYEGNYNYIVTDLATSKGILHLTLKDINDEYQLKVLSATLSIGE